MEYQVKITETLAKVVTVKATTEDEAIEKVQQMYNFEEVVLCADDFADVEFGVVGVETKNVELGSDKGKYATDNKTIKIELDSYMVLDSLQDLSIEYSTTVDILANIAIHRLLYDIRFFRELRKTSSSTRPFHPTHLNAQK